MLDSLLHWDWEEILKQSWIFRLIWARWSETQDSGMDLDEEGTLVQRLNLLSDLDSAEKLEPLVGSQMADLLGK